jgi:hypothetical protein
VFIIPATCAVSIVVGGIKTAVLFRGDKGKINRLNPKIAGKLQFIQRP